LQAAALVRSQSVKAQWLLTTRATDCDVKKVCTQPTDSIHVLCTILRINNNYLPEQY